MLLKGSCHCGRVRFSVRSHTPYPFNLCYCSICRKTAGGGGYAINIMGETESLQVEGAEHISIYQAQFKRGGKAKPSDTLRHFCKHCGAALWAWSPPWPNWVYPFASAIDTKLPTPPARVHLMLGSKANWVDVPPEGPSEAHFDEYPAEIIADWHKQRGLWVD